MVHEIEKFFGCYLLVCKHEKFKGRTYVGFTVDPNRRIEQHNTGHHKGGARRTSGKGPWEMILTIHGFPNMVSALQFEWAWQNPQKSLKLPNVHGRHKKLKGFEYKFAIVGEMLRTGPWNRLPLTIRWLNQDYSKDFPVNLQPPKHMPIVYGPVKSLKPGPKKKKEEKETHEKSCHVSPSCAICKGKCIDENEMLKCLKPGCDMASHLRCLAAKFLVGTDHLLPVTGDCPKCDQEMLWGDMIRQQQGCYQNPEVLKECEESDEEMDENHWATQLTQRRN